MPKKFQNENTKAVAAKERKAAAKQQEQEKLKKQADDAYWADDDKSNARKQQRKEEKDRKKQQVLQKKAESKELAERELASISTSKKPTASKMTRAEVEAEQLKRQQAAAAAAASAKESKKRIVAPEPALEENLNRLRDFDTEARNVDEALSLLSDKMSLADKDKHPERRAKAAFAAFKEANLPGLKADHPDLRHTQLQELLFKEWHKSPQNPFNQQ